MKQYSVRQVILITNQQHESILKLSKYDVNISQFIRQAIKEKIQRDWKIIKEEKEKIKLPF